MTATQASIDALAQKIEDDKAAILDAVSAASGKFDNLSAEVDKLKADAANAQPPLDTTNLEAAVGDVGDAVEKLKALAATEQP